MHLAWHYVVIIIIQEFQWSASSCKSSWFFWLCFVNKVHRNDSAYVFATFTLHLVKPISSIVRYSIMRDVICLMLFHVSSMTRYRARYGTRATVSGLEHLWCMNEMLANVVHSTQCTWAGMFSWYYLWQDYQVRSCQANVHVFGVATCLCLPSPTKFHKARANRDINLN